MSPAPFWGGIFTKDIIPGNLINLLTWTAPSNSDDWIFQYTQIRRRTDTFPISISDGMFVTNVSGSGKVYHVDTGLENDESYYYSLFSVYNSGSYGPYTLGPATPSSANQFFNDVLITFTKLGTNTRLYSREQRFNVVDLIIWLPSGQEERKTAIQTALKNIKPAHTLLRVFWESCYVAQTTTAQFMLGSYDSDVYTIENGTIINKVPTIDSSFSGDTTL